MVSLAALLAYSSNRMRNKRKNKIKKTDGKKAGRSCCYDLPIYFGTYVLMLEPSLKAIREFAVDELIQHDTLHYIAERWERDILNMHIHIAIAEPHLPC